MTGNWPPYCGAESAADPVKVCVLIDHPVTDKTGGQRHKDENGNPFWLTRKVRTGNSSRPE